MILSQFDHFIKYITLHITLVEPVPHLVKLVRTRDVGRCETRSFDLQRKCKTLEHLRGYPGEVWIDF